MQTCRKDAENSALTIPLCVTGSAAEPDAELVAQISGFVASHVGLNTNLTAIEREIAEAEKVAREEAKKKHKVGGKGGTKAVASTSATPPSAPSKPEPAPPPNLSLFDQQSQTAAGEQKDATSGSATASK